MGQSHSMDSLNPEKYESIHLSADGFTAQWSTVAFRFDQKPVNLRDSALWDEFGKAIDEELPKINKHMGTVFLIIPLIFLCFIGAALLGQNGGIYFVIIFVPCFFGLPATQIWIIQRNQSVDKAIDDICAKYNQRFQQHGIIPEYRTKFTGACKPKGAVPRRLLVFKPTAKTSSA